MSTFKDKFIAAGNDYAALSERTFGDETLIAELMGMLLADESFGEMRECMEKGETESAFRAAHSLKGSCGMLGFTALFENMKCITEFLRHGDLESAKKAYPQVLAEYERAMELISEI